MNSAIRCTTIPANLPFAATLAGWILQNYGKTGHNLVDILILVPSRRACRTLRDAFLELSGGEPLILPRIQPIGDMEEAGLMAWGAPVPEVAAISPMRRHMLLTRLVLQYEKQQQGKYFSTEHAAQLARQLMQFLDGAIRDGADLANLSTLVPDELSQHWQHTLEFLKIISQHWPKILEQENAMEPVAHRNALLLATAEAWEKSPPAFPVIAAGSTGSQKATARLLSVIAKLPQGIVVLPALDTQMDPKSWEEISYTHPQYGLKQLLTQMGYKHQEIPLLMPASTQTEKAECLRSVFAPANTTSHWAEVSLPLKSGLGHIRFAVADTQLDEARIIAVAMRKLLEEPGKTAALITTDRTLARMVVAQMARFGIKLDDSAGVPLADTPTAVFMRLVAECVTSEASPSSLLAMLSHPLCSGGEDTVTCRATSRELDRYVLRGIRHESGLRALCEDKSASPGLRQFLTKIKPHYDAFAAFFSNKKTVPLADILSAHIAFAEYMASQEHTPGGVLLWKGDSATQLAESLADMAQHADVLGAIDPFDYPGFLQATLASETYRAPYGLHPRLHILSPIEARMQQFDVVILGGLNEGVWPELTNTDPWMSRPMREAFGLQALERSIGQSAHDFYSLCHAPDVLITRSRKVSGAPAIASRWLIRIMTLLDGKDKPLLMALDETAYYEEAKSQLDTPALLAPLNRPAPCPPIAARPNRMRLTAVDAWVRDPYMVYAKYVLGLEKLEPLDQDPSAADLGTLIHKALENFVRDHPKDIPQDGYTKLLAIGKEVFAVYANRPAMAMVWWPRFEAIAQWFIEREKEIRASTKHVHVEKKGELQISTGDDTFTLTTRIDRIEIANDNTATIADYKTGSIPSDSDIKQGLSNQLALEALIATHGKVEGYIPNPGTPRLCYWKLAANPAQAEIKEIAADLEATRQRLESLIRDYANPNMPYAAQSNPALLPRYNDYEHLTRRQEWGMV